MAIDLRNEHGDLDRSRVISQVEQRAQIRDTVKRIDALVDLMDEVHEAAYQDGERQGYISCQDQA